MPRPDPDLLRTAALTIAVLLVTGAVAVGAAPTASAEPICLGTEEEYVDSPDDPGMQIGVGGDCGFHSCDGVNVLVMMNDECSGGCEGVTVIGPLTSDSCGDPDDRLRNLVAGAR